MSIDVLITIILIVIISFCTLKIISCRNSTKNELYPPGPLSFPILGSIPQLMMAPGSNMFEKFSHFSKKYGDILTLKIGSRKHVLINDIDIGREMLTSDTWISRVTIKNPLVSKRSFSKELGILFNDGGNIWRETRNFSKKSLREFGFGKKMSMDKGIELEVVSLVQNIKEKINKNGPVLNIKKLFLISSLNIIWAMVAGQRFSHDDEKLKKLVDLNNRVTRISTIGEFKIGNGGFFGIFPTLAKFLSFFIKFEVLEAVETMKAYIKSLLMERRNELNDEQPKAFADLFIKEIEKHKNDYLKTDIYSDENFIVTILDIFQAGSETSSNSLEFALLFLVKNPHVKKRLVAEIDEVIGKERLPSISDEPNMPYTRATILEIWRCGCAIPVAGRYSPVDTHIRDYKIEKDSFTVVSIYGLHYSEKIWENPKEFNPSRFLNENNEIVNSNKLITFGAGKRVCFGQSLAETTLFIFVTTFFQQFEIELAPGYEDTSTEPIMGFSFSPQPFSASFKPRNNL